MDTLPLFLDFEASGLGPHGFPIQVAWSRPDESVECWLIKPDEEWLIEDGWDPNAEALHGIRRELILEFGKEPAWICARMNEQLASQTVYCDGGMYDRLWLNQLFECADEPRRFELGDLYALLDELLPDRVTKRFGWFDPLREAAWRRVPGRPHQADVDVRYLMELYRIVQGRVAG